MTAAIWIADCLQHQYGVDLSTTPMGEGALETPTRHGNPTSCRPEAGIDRPEHSGKSLSRLPGGPERTRRHHRGPNLPSPIGKNPNVCSGLFPGFRTAEKDYYPQTGIFPNHSHLIVRAAIPRAAPVRGDQLLSGVLRVFQERASRRSLLGTLRYMLPG